MRALVREHSGRPFTGLLGCVVLTCVCGLAYARTVPRWNNPDEPAHWNYIVFVASTGRLPVLTTGDYPTALIDELKNLRFPPGRSIDSITYESHQPPLYYVIGALVYRLFSTQTTSAAVLAVKCMSILFACGLVILTYLLARLVAPDNPAVWVASALFVALLPMHLNMAAAVDNDTLGDLLLAAFALCCVMMIKRGLSTGEAVGAGVLLGLGLLTKVTVLVAIPLLIAAGVYRWWKEPPGKRSNAARAVAMTILFAVLVAAWWPVRNMLTYGAHDPLGLDRNKAVVPQPLTGPITFEAARRWATITFDSFWGQFGWMGIPLNDRIYRILFVASLIAFCGIVSAGLRRLAEGASVERWAISLFCALWLALVIGDDLWYNLTFIQAQGRYLYPAIPVFGLVFGVGFLEFAPSRWRWMAVAGAGASLLLLNWYIVVRVLYPFFSG